MGSAPPLPSNPRNVQLPSPSPCLPVSYLPTRLCPHLEIAFAHRDTMKLQDHLRAVPNPAFYSVRVTKSHAVSYLQQYRQYQWLAASRGLLLDTVPKASNNDVPHRDEYAAGRLNEDNELVLARLRKTQSSLQTPLSQLDSDLARLENALLVTRKRVWVRTGTIALIVSAILTFVFASFRGVHTHILGLVPRSLQPFVPLLPSPIAVYLIAARERQISAVQASRARLEGLRISAASSYPVTADEVSWVGSEKWDGVNWAVVGL